MCHCIQLGCGKKCEIWRTAQFGCEHMTYVRDCSEFFYKGHNKHSKSTNQNWGQVRGCNEKIFLKAEFWE